MIKRTIGDSVREPETAPAAKMRDTCGRLKEAWYAAGLSTGLGAKRPIGCVILGEPLVLWRKADGGPVAKEDRCAHRNAPLSHGKVSAGAIGCPYHGWTYDAQGRCVSVPSEGPGAAPPRCAIRSFPVLERHGLLWVWMGDGAPSAEPFPMPYRETPGWGSYYMVTEFRNEVTHLVENFMDVPHTRFVHSGWFRKQGNKRIRVVVERTADSVLVTYHQPDDKIGFTGRILNPGNAPMGHTDNFYMPNTTRVDYTFGPRRGFTITSTCTPRGPFDTVVYTLITYKLGWMNALSPLWLPFYTRKVIQQDVDIMRIQGDNLRRFGGKPRFHSTQADLLHRFIESLRDHAERDDGSDPPAPRVEEVSFWI